jgi:hypothetical protein
VGERERVPRRRLPIHRSGSSRADIGAFIPKGRAQNCPSNPVSQQRGAPRGRVTVVS